MRRVEPRYERIGRGSTNVPRRAIVITANCQNCHAYLNVFTKELVHAGQRNDTPTCQFCHNMHRVNSGWGLNTKQAVHMIHYATGINATNVTATTGYSATGFVILTGLETVLSTDTVLSPFVTPGANYGSPFIKNRIAVGLRSAKK